MPNRITFLLLHAFWIEALPWYYKIMYLNFQCTNGVGLLLKWEAALQMNLIFSAFLFTGSWLYMSLTSLLAVMQALQSLDSYPTNSGKSLAIGHTITTRVLPLQKRRWRKKTGDRRSEKAWVTPGIFQKNLHFSLPQPPVSLAVQLPSFLITVKWTH